MRMSVALLNLIAAALLLPACGGGGPSSGEDGVIRVGNRSEVQDLDPHLVTGVAEWRALGALFQGLVDLDPETLAPIPGVASAWTVSDDGLTYNFTLRDNARWSNGDPVTAADFTYAWQRILSPALGGPYAYLLHCLKNGAPYNEGTLEDFSQVGVKALDPHTLEVTLENPTPYFLGMQVHFAWFPVHRGAIEARGAMTDRTTGWTLPGNFVSNGAYALKDWRPDAVLETVPNPYYWAPETVKNRGIYFYPISDELTEERNFRSGQLDMTYTVPMHRVKHYRETEPDSLQIHPYLGAYFYRFNTTRAPFDDARVRRAFGMAIDREALAEHVLQSGEAPAWFFTPPDTAGYTSEARVAFDPDGARALLVEAGYPDGQGLRPVELLYNSAGAEKIIAEAVQRMWKTNLGADVQLLNQDYKVYLATMENLDYDIARSIWIGDVVDPINFLELFVGGGGNNRTGWVSAAYDRAIQAAYAEADPAARLQSLQRAERALLDAAPVTPVYFYTQKYLQSPTLKGVHYNPVGYFRWQDFYLENPRELAADPAKP